MIFPSTEFVMMFKGDFHSEPCLKKRKMAIFKGEWLGKYTIHGSYGLGRVPQNLRNSGVNADNHSTIQMEHLGDGRW